MAGETFARGRNTFFRVYFQNQPQVLYVKSWAIKELAEETKDDVGGENRSRFDTIVNGYSITFECFEESTSQLLQNILLATANDDAFNPPIDIASGVLFRYQNGGSTAAFTLNGCTRPPVDVKMTGRTETIMHTVNLRCQYFKQVVSA